MGVAVTILFWLAFALTAPIACLLSALLYALTAPFDPTRRAVHGFICRWTFRYLRLWPGWKVEVLGRERLPKGPAVLVSNHQSMADIVAAMGLFHPFKFVSKASLFSLPVVGWSMSLAGYVRVERGRPHSMRRMLDSCRQWLKKGVPVLLFPEGTYSEGKLLPFKRGAFRLAIEEQLPLVPVLIEGTRGLIVGDGPWLRPKCHIRVSVMPPIPPEALGTDDGALAERVRGLYARALGQA
ncbi:MAG: 1-acyl-sn-glycerol-3-phosphate acyltransferase [Myxococcales bacterium]|nr:1-acyl-sn-glycerol-3-phosphate acyltransferase [Myxococcales bacterium]